MSGRDKVGTNDSVSVGLERTPPKRHLDLVSEPRCPKCGDLTRSLEDGKRGCANESCGHIFTPGN